MVDAGSEPKGLREWVVWQLGFDNLTADAMTLVRMVSENDNVAYQRYLELVDQFRVFAWDAPSTATISEADGLSALMMLKALCQRPHFYLPRLSVACLICFARGHEIACEAMKRSDLLDISVVQLLEGSVRFVPGQRPERVAELHPSEEGALRLELRNLARAAGIDWSDCQPIGTVEGSGG